MKLKMVMVPAVGLAAALVLSACSTNDSQMRQAGQALVTNGQALQANGQTMTLAPALARSASAGANAGQNMQANAQTMMDSGKMMQTQGQP